MKIALVTGSRADWSLLRPVAQQLRESPLDAEIWVTGSHLEQAFGYTVEEITTQGFAVNAQVPLKIATNTPRDTSKALAAALSGFADVIAQRQPDILLVLGDRFEIFGAVQAASLAGITIAHIAGGDITEGAYDDAMRHAISKLSHLHFPTNGEAEKRLIQMGEQPQHVVLCGSPGIDAILQTPKLSRDTLTQQLGIRWQTKNIAVAFHPATNDAQTLDDQILQLCNGLDALPPHIGIIVTGSNADTGGLQMNQALQAFCDHHPHATFVQSLGAQRYYSIVAEADLLAGNSSSGLYEAPTLKTPTLDIGSRQQGRLRGPSVFHCANRSEEITPSITRMIETQSYDYASPYGEGQAAKCIIDTLMSLKQRDTLRQKIFYQGDR